MLQLPCIHAHTRTHTHTQTNWTDYKRYTRFDYLCNGSIIVVQYFQNEMVNAIKLV